MDHPAPGCYWIVPVDAGLLYMVTIFCNCPGHDGGGGVIKSTAPGNISTGPGPRTRATQLPCPVVYLYRLRRLADGFPKPGAEIHHDLALWLIIRRCESSPRQIAGVWLRRTTATIGHGADYHAHSTGMPGMKHGLTSGYLSVVHAVLFANDTAPAGQLPGAIWMQIPPVTPESLQIQHKLTGYSLQTGLYCSPEQVRTVCATPVR
jgi:hypothetical protein